MVEINKKIIILHFKEIINIERIIMKKYNIYPYHTDLIIGKKKIKLTNNIEVVDIEEKKRKTGTENLCENAAGMQTMTNGLSHGMNCFHRKISREQHSGIVA